jgi:hypothetical protein
LAKFDLFDSLNRSVYASPLKRIGLLFRYFFRRTGKIVGHQAGYMVKYNIPVFEVNNKYSCCVRNWNNLVFLEVPFLVFPQAEGFYIRASRRQSTVEQGAEDIYALAGVAFAKTVFKYPAQAGFLIKKLAGRRKINGDFTGGAKGTGVTALPTAVT